jgi:uncharacterized membrane protein (UPF0127 family)
MQTVQVVNISKNEVVAQEAQLAVTMNQRMKGLLGREGLKANEALILEPCSSIHTFFMRFPIDVLFLDKNMQVIRVIQNMVPNRLSPIVWVSRMAIELPAGKVSQTNTQIGDKIELK